MADLRGFGGSRIDEPEIKSATIAASASGDNTIVSAVSGKRIAVIGWVWVAQGTVNVKWKDGAATDKTGAMNFQAREGVSVPLGAPHRYWFIGSTNTALILNLSAAVQVDGIVTYQEID